MSNRKSNSFSQVEFAAKHAVHVTQNCSGFINFPSPLALVLELAVLVELVLLLPVATGDRTGANSPTVTDLSARSASNFSCHTINLKKISEAKSKLLCNKVT